MFVDLNFLILSLHIFHTFLLKTSLTASKYLSVLRGTHKYLCWQLGLAEKNILNYDFDPVASDPSDANTNSTTLFSDDTDDLSRRSTNPEMGMSTHQEDEVSIMCT